MRYSKKDRGSIINVEGTWATGWGQVHDAPNPRHFFSSFWSAGRHTQREEKTGEMRVGFAAAGEEFQRVWFCRGRGRERIVWGHTHH
jgi:hypothetical protein